jgi:hypothetical protein
MEVRNLDIKIQKAFGNLHRKKHALIAVRDLENNILVGTKPSFYPEGISRMIGGGIDESEDECVGAARELEEELSIKAAVNELIPLLQVNVHAEDLEGEIFENSTYIYFYQLKDNKYKAADDIESIVKLSLEGLKELGDKFERLDEDNWYKGVEGTFGWEDYGKMYGPIHKFTAIMIKELNL